MTEPYGPICRKCRSRKSECRCLFKSFPEPPADPASRALLATYVALRQECIGLEQLIESGAADGLTADDLKRLDKAVTVMKVGFKMVKKVLRSRGVDGLKVWREPQAADVPAVG